MPACMCAHVRVQRVRAHLCVSGATPPPPCLAPLPPSQLCEAGYCYASLALWLLALIPCLSFACSSILLFYFFLLFFNFFLIVFACLPIRLFSPALLSYSSPPSPTSLPSRVPSSLFHLGFARAPFDGAFSQKRLSLLVVSRLSHPLALFTLLSA